jgi:hypothetical protein
LSVCFISTIGRAQKCALDKDETDAFTGEVARSYKHLFFTGKYIGRDHVTATIFLTRKGKNYTCTIAPQLAGRHLVAAPAGTVLLIKLENGSILNEVMPADVTPVFNGNSTSWALTFNSDAAKMEQLAASPVVAIKTIVDNTEFQMSEIRNSDQDKIKKAAACLLK